MGKPAFRVCPVLILQINTVCSCLVVLHNFNHERRYKKKISLLRNMLHCLRGNPDPQRENKKLGTRKRGLIYLQENLCYLCDPHIPTFHFFSFLKLIFALKVYFRCNFQLSIQYFIAKKQNKSTNQPKKIPPNICI